ncbi:hypothetical protein LSAT2_004278 [Lamellibrachia satsuma]|nr:hypothetical protein LSAT2_004278 [Lamellibrachia satsuma]
MAHYYTTPGMLPPPPPPPVARPVPILRTSDPQGAPSSHNTTSTITSNSTNNGSVNNIANATSNSPIMPPVNRGIMTSPFTAVLQGRLSEHAFAHIHPQQHQMFTYPSISPFSAISGVISPTTFSLMASPVVTPRTTPRTTPIPRWSTPFIPLDESPDYSMMVSLVSGTNSDESLQDERFLHLMPSHNEPMDASNAGGQSGASANKHTGS